MPHGRVLTSAWKTAISLSAIAGLAVLGGCSGEQSTFNAAGTEASSVLMLFWVLLAGATLIWLIVVGISVYVTKVKPGRHSDRAGVRLIVWGGCIFPVVTLGALLYFGLGMMPGLRGKADGPIIAVSGERFWWRVNYGVEGTPGVAKSLPKGGGYRSAWYVPVGEFHGVHPRGGAWFAALR